MCVYSHHSSVCVTVCAQKRNIQWIAMSPQGIHHRSPMSEVFWKHGWILPHSQTHLCWNEGSVFKKLETGVCLCVYISQHLGES